MQKIAFLVLVSLMTACGSLHLKTHYTSFGTVDIARDKAIADRVNATRRDPPGAEKDVAVLVDSVPAGLGIELGAIKVLPGFGHRVLGRFRVGPNSSILPGFFADYRDGWRKGFCYWQDPLVWLTLTLWWIVPLNYPCWSKNASEKLDIISHVKKVVAAAGGDTAIMWFFMDVDAETAWGASGFVIKLDPRMKGKPLDSTPIPKKPVGNPI